MNASKKRCLHGRVALILVILLFCFAMAGCDEYGNIAIPEVAEGGPSPEYDLYEKMHVNDDNYKTSGISRDELLAFFPDLPLPEEFMGVPFFCANVNAPYEYHDGVIAQPAERQYVSGITLYYMRDNFEGGVHQIRIVTGEFNVRGVKLNKEILSESPERYVYITEETGRVSDVVEVRDGCSYVFFGSVSSSIEIAEAYIVHDEVQAFINGMEEWLKTYNPKPANVSEEMWQKWQQTLKARETESEPELGLNLKMRKGNQIYGGVASAISREELLSYFPDLPVPEEFMGSPFMFASVSMSPPIQSYPGEYIDPFPEGKIVEIDLVPENVASISIGYRSDENFSEYHGVHIIRSNIVISNKDLTLEWLSNNPEKYVYVSKERGTIHQAIERRDDRNYGFSGTSIATVSDAEPYLNSEEAQDLIAALDEWFHKP